jgi:ribosome biogenesis GTPase
VKAAAEAGSLDPGRLESYRKLQGEQAEIERRREQRAQIDAKRLGRAGSKALRSLYKDRERRDR